MLNLKIWKNQFWWIEQIMKRDLFTVLESDLIDLVADIMNNRNIRHVPVENDEGFLVGLVSSKQLIQYYSKTKKYGYDNQLVKDIMIDDLVVVNSDITTIEAIQLMKENRVSFLPVAKDKKLVGLVTEYDFVQLTAFLLRELDNNIPINY